jgi:anthranilate phosphoribosyltransferase
MNRTSEAEQNLNEFLARLEQGENLSRAEASALLERLIDAETTDAQIRSALVAFARKGETVDEIVGFAEALRARCVKIKARHENFVDTAGTGASRAKIFNVSTAAAFVIAGAGLPVAKHGARAATSAAGSADVLGELGVNVSVAPEISERCLNEIGICFLFAPLYHAATARVARIRRELGIRTVFNLLGPLTNPARAPRQIIGVYDARFVEPVARALAALGTTRAYIVHGRDGLDEITLAAPTTIAEVAGGDVELFEVTPEAFGLERRSLDGLRGRCGDAATNARIIRAILSGERRDAAREIVLMNAAAVLMVGGVAGNLFDAMQLATESIDSGAAQRKLQELMKATKV